MGFRSTTTSEDHGPWPEWFREKYQDCLYFGERGAGPLASKRELSLYKMCDFEADVQKAIDWNQSHRPFVIVYLHECGGITRVLVYPDRIEHFDAAEGDGHWDEVDETWHHYCGSHVGHQYVRPLQVPPA